jgi:hypothetical protein
MEEGPVREAVDYLTGILITGTCGVESITSNERRTIEGIVAEGRAELGRLQELRETWDTEVVAEETPIEENATPTSTEEENFPEAVSLYRLVIHDLKHNRHLSYVEEIYAPLLLSFGWHIFNLVNSNCKAHCRTPYAKDKDYRACPRYFDPQIPSRSITYDYGSPDNSRLSVMFVGRSAAGKSFSFKVLTDSANSYLVEPKEPVLPVVGTTALSVAGLFGSLDIWKEIREEEKKKEAKREKRKKKTEEEVPLDAEEWLKTNAFQTETEIPASDAPVPLRMVPVTPPPEWSALTHGDAHDKCDGIYYFSEFASISDLGQQDHNSNLLNEFLELLSSGNIRRRYKWGTYSHVSRMTIWGGIQPERLNLIAGLFRRFAYIYIDLNEEDELERTKALFDVATRPPREDILRETRRIVRELYERFDVQSVTYTDAFREFILAQAADPKNSLQADDARILLQMAVGYTVVAKWGVGMNNLVVDLDSTLQRILERQIASRRIIALLGSAIGRRELVLEHLRRDIAKHGPLPMDEIRLRLVRSTSLGADEVEDHLLYLRGMDKFRNTFGTAVFRPVPKEYADKRVRWTVLDGPMPEETLPETMVRKSRKRHG